MNGSIFCNRGSWVKINTFCCFFLKYKTISCCHNKNNVILWYTIWMGCFSNSNNFSEVIFQVVVFRLQKRGINPPVSFACWYELLMLVVLCRGPKPRPKIMAGSVNPADRNESHITVKAVTN